MCPQRQKKARARSARRRVLVAAVDENETSEGKTHLFIACHRLADRPTIGLPPYCVSGAHLPESASGSWPRPALSQTKHILVNQNYLFRLPAAADSGLHFGRSPPPPPPPPPPAPPPPPRVGALYIGGGGGVQAKWHQWHRHR
jgi:hypothetical protein